MRRLCLDRPLRLLAPAKLNLGLEVVGRRPDGYHEVVTILQAVSIFDRIELTPAERFSYEATHDLPLDDDLAYRAVEVARDAFDVEPAFALHVAKHIPLASGLGGGSSDAGTILAALAALAGRSIAEAEQAAARLGSDVPFFVRGGTALATGTGATLELLPPPRQRIWFVVVVPAIAIPAKTATLYGELRLADFSDGATVREQAARLRRAEALDLSRLPSAFSRPLRTREPVRQAIDALFGAGARHVTISGAGPAVFAAFPTWDAAASVYGRLRDVPARTVLCASVPAEPNHFSLAELRGGRGSVR